ncbi:hypothetical protein BC940DRAFT_292921 [Gongronella butleri]|nr:hypothetical protein BC940DRAFT_292921 [Gongronella butleri]
MHTSQKAGVLLMAMASVASAQNATTSNSTSTSSGLLPQTSPTWLPQVSQPANVVTSYPAGPYNLTTTLPHTTLNLSAYPEPWASPDTTAAEVQAAYNSIDWSKVPAAPVNKDQSNGDISFQGYNADSDPYCWWSDTNCVKPKVDYLPEDVYNCPNVGDWGLNYDDGPYNYADNDPVLNNYSEPQLYNFLAEHNNQKATLFYIGSNVVTYPAAAQRALNDGHIICVHTWSHPQMTTQSNEKVVAEFYWTLKAIKETLNITPKCWRPPYGDVDDRVRAIAWQMGMRTMVWDEDSNDWNMPGDGGGNLPWDTVNGYFEGWVQARQNGSDNSTGHIVLEHELNNSTVMMTEKWLPTLQSTFNVKSIHDCLGITDPYWETGFVYPANASGNQTSHNSTTTSNSTVSGSGSAAGSSSNANGSTSGAAQVTVSSVVGLFVAMAAAKLF